jgi:hypothetical protein
MDRAMDFEVTMRVLFGDKADHIASAESNPAERRDWLQKAVKQLTVLANELDTTVRHRERLSADLEELSELLKGVNDPSWDIVYRLFRLVIRLFGYDYVKGARCHTPSYWQSASQYYTADMCDGGDVLQDHFDRKTAIAIRKELVLDLIAKGHTTFKIALILNTSEHEIKKLRSA